MCKIKVIGAGLAGCEAAYALAERGHKVALYDIKPFDRGLLNLYLSHQYPSSFMNLPAASLQSGSGVNPHSESLLQSILLLRGLLAFVG